MSDFLPVCQADLQKRGWDRLDFIIVSGDAYVDHSSFGAALISRVLEGKGHRVGMICQPDWTNPESFRVLGRPKLAFLVTGGNMDTMVLHYSVGGKKRGQDYYTPKKEMGKRPDRATIVYCAAIRQAFKKIPIIIGGIETSLRRFSHYDYWSDKVRRSILLDSKADLAVYGMGERAILEISERMSKGEELSKIRNVRGTLYKCKRDEVPDNSLILPNFSEVKLEKAAYARSFLLQYKNTDPISSKTLAEPYSPGEVVVQNPPSLPLDQKMMDWVYELPFTRQWHPSYDKDGGIAALEEVKFSLTSSRGCFGGCSFCALTFHQGKAIQARSHQSLLREAKLIIQDPDFKGYIHDVGGPTANFRQNSCCRVKEKGACTTKNCLAPEPCKNLEVDHRDYLSLLTKLRKLPGVKKVFIRSGVRFDYLMQDGDHTFLREMIKHHVSGQLKVAPEHVSDPVLKLMGKPPQKVFQKFRGEYEKINQKLGLKQFMVPYFISSHPGSTLKDAIKIAEYLRDTRFRPDQVQDFYPTPGTLSTCMYHTGLDPRTMKKVYVARTHRDKAKQRALLQYTRPENARLVEEALREAGRSDLIGNGPLCLIRGGGGRKKSFGKSPSNQAQLTNKYLKEKRPGRSSFSAPSKKAEKGTHGPKKHSSRTRKK